MGNLGAWLIKKLDATASGKGSVERALLEELIVTIWHLAHSGIQMELCAIFLIDLYHQGRSHAEEAMWA